MGAKGQKQNRYPGHFKQTVVEDTINNGLGYREAGKKYGVHGTLIAIWEEKYLSEGPDALYGEKRGKTKTDRPSGFSHSDEAKLKRLRKKLQDLGDALLDGNERAELNHLRMENALLKKLQALVQK